MCNFYNQTEESNQKRRKSYSLTGGIVKKAGHDSERAFAEAFQGKVISIEKNDHGDRKKEDVVTERYGKCSVKKGDKIQMLWQVIPMLTKRFGEDHIVIRYAQAAHSFKKNKNENTHLLGMHVANEFKDWLKVKDNFKEVLCYALGGYNEIDSIVDMINTDNKVAYVSEFYNAIDFITNMIVDVRVTRNLSIVTDIKGKMGALSYEIRKNGLLFKMFGTAVLGNLRKQSFCREVSLK
jgi:hypothetical protein